MLCRKSTGEEQGWKLGGQLGSSCANPFHNVEAELAKPAFGYESAMNGKGLDVNGKEKAKTELMLGLPALGWLGMPLRGRN